MWIKSVGYDTVFAFYSEVQILFLLNYINLDYCLYLFSKQNQTFGG